MTEPGDRGNPGGGVSRRGFSCLVLAFVLSMTLGMAGLIFVAGVFMTGACGCLSTPDANWTPPPVTASQAAVYAAKMAGLPSMSADLSGGPDGRAYYVATAPDAVAFVDGVSGSVVEVVLEDRMPNDAKVSISGAEAVAASQVFLQQRMGDTGFIASSRAISVAGVAAFMVTWSDAGGTAKLETAVNASTGDVFAYADVRTTTVTLPIVGRARATELAIAALGVPGETVTSAELTIDLVASSWGVGLGVPTATQADVFEHGAYINVDAVTGQATIVKS